MNFPRKKPKTARGKSHNIQSISKIFSKISQPFTNINVYYRRTFNLVICKKNTS